MHLLTKLAGCLAAETHASYTADLIATLLTDAQNKRQTVRRNQWRHHDEDIRASHCAQQCRLAAVGRHRSLVFPGGMLRFPRRGLFGRSRPRQGLADVDDATGRYATCEPTDELGGGLLRVARHVEQTAVATVSAVQR